MPDRPNARPLKTGYHGQNGRLLMQAEFQDNRTSHGTNALDHGPRNQHLFPHLKITHALADALLIAEHGRRAVSMAIRRMTIALSTALRAFAFQFFGSGGDSIC